MIKILAPAKFVLLTLAVTLALLVGAVMTPHDPYYRWQELQTQFSRKGDWIYERLHFDPTRLDIALVGTSRTANGFSGPEVERAYCVATGRRVRVANFGYAGTGRNIEYVIAKEVVRTKHPALVLAELNEVELRRQHESFIVVAEPLDVLTAPPIINALYVADIGRLPGRQLSLFVKTLFKTPNVRPSFDPAAYEGPDMDRSQALKMLDGTLRSRFVRVPEKVLEKDLRARRRDQSDIRLPKPLQPLEHHVARHYLRAIERLVAAGGGSLQYVFIPAYKEPTLPPRVLNQLAIDGAVIDLGGAIAFEKEKWRDATHTNAWGSLEQSRRLGGELARAHPMLGEATCDPGQLGAAAPS